MGLAMSVGDVALPASEFPADVVLLQTELTGFLQKRFPSQRFCGKTMITAPGDLYCYLGGCKQFM